MRKLSVTFLSSYLYCPRKLYLEQVLKIFRIPKEAMVKGTVRHQVFEGINNAEKELVILIEKEKTHTDIEELYRQKYSQILKDIIENNKRIIEEANLEPADTLKNTWPFILSEASARAQNAFFFARKANLFGHALWDALTPKTRSEVRIESDNQGLKGIIDELKIYENEIVPVELKTGKAPQTGVWPGHKVQTGAYMMMLIEQGQNVKEGVIRYLDHDIERQVILDQFLKKEIIELTKKVRELMNSKIPPRCINKNKCGACQLFEDCRAK